MKCTAHRVGVQGKGLSNNVRQVHADFLQAAQRFQQVQLQCNISASVAGLPAYKHLLAQGLHDDSKLLTISLLCLANHCTAGGVRCDGHYRASLCTGLQAVQVGGQGSGAAAGISDHPGMWWWVLLKLLPVA